tara:strand:- start:194 stop:412 length:219 start_codon:yes stop_codon:yes gene_type:complete
MLREKDFAGFLIEVHRVEGRKNRRKYLKSCEESWVWENKEVNMCRNILNKQNKKRRKKKRKKQKNKVSKINY